MRRWAGGGVTMAKGLSVLLGAQLPSAFLPVEWICRLVEPYLYLQPHDPIAAEEKAT